MAKNFLDYDGLGFFTSLIKSFISKKTVNNAVTTGGTGAAYTATVDGITALAAGVSFMMIPHVTSTVVLPTLNVNGLGAKNIRRRVSNSTVTTVASGSANWLYANKPVKVTYDGTYWIADMDRPNATDIYGTLAIDNGGTGASTAEGALENLGALSMELLWENASPTSDFAGQRINMDLTKGWGVRGIFSSSGGTLILDAKDYKKGTSNGRVQTAGATNSFRTIDVDDNGVTLGDGKSLKTYGTATIENVNSTLIPLKFYIIKGVSA